MNEIEKKMMENLRNMIKGMKKIMPHKALEFPESGVWLNTSEPLTLEKLKGHIILLDFWTYCCINCIHVIEDLKYLEDKYKDDPLVVIGVHSAKFNNEKDKDNIRSAVSRYEIRHPILIDNDLYLWKSYGINAWPSFLVIDTIGNVIGKAAGEGKRELLDNFIQKLLEKGKIDGTLANQKISIEPDIGLESFLKFPGKLSIDSEKNILFISDSNHNRILKVQLEENDIGKVVKIIGNGIKGLKDGSFTDAEFNLPQGIAYLNNKLYVADTGNHAIRLIDFDKETVSIISGNGKQGFQRNYRGNPTNISLNSPWDIVVDENFLYIAMAGTHQLWRYDRNKEIIENYAGSGAENIIDGGLENSSLAQPSGLTLDNKNRRLHFADSEVSGLRYVDFKTQQVKTLIGKGLFIFGMKDGLLKDSLLQHPLGVEFKEDKIYIADTYNHAIRVADLASETLTTLIYRPRKGICRIGDKDCDVLPLYEPNDIKHIQNKLFITDTNNHLIRIFDLGKKELRDLYLY